MSDPFAIQGPALISFSGGRSSAFMLYRILQAHGGTLPDDVVVMFANTGKEMPQTLAFVDECSKNWGVRVYWLEYQDNDDPQKRWTMADYSTAMRDGEPYAAMIARKKYLPNPVTRFCTIELKIRVMKFFCQQYMNWKEWTQYIGLRADEKVRVAKVRARGNTEGWDTEVPLATAGIAKADVTAFWAAQNFDLRLPNVNGKTPMGNCDLCFLKSAAQISAIMRDRPELATWWIDQEQNNGSKLASTARFRSDRPSYAALFKAVQDQRAFDFGDADELNDCFCGEP